MSIFSDYAHGCMSDFEFEQECARMNREDRCDRERLDEDDNCDKEDDE